MRVKDWPTPPPPPPRLTAHEAAAIERGEMTWEDVVRQHEARAILRRLRPPLPEPEPAVTEFGRSERETGFDPALADLAATATIVALACFVIYVLSRVLP